MAEATQLHGAPEHAPTKTLATDALTRYPGALLAQMVSKKLLASPLPPFVKGGSKDLLDTLSVRREPPEIIVYGYTGSIVPVHHV